MSKRNKDYRPGKKPIFVILYIAAVIVLTGALAFMWHTVRTRQKEQMKVLQQIAADETEYIRMTESESETEAHTETEKKEQTTEVTAETETETESETEDRKALSILVLNGTRKPGVAAYWKETLEKDGYTNVYTASYNKEVEDYTLLYSSDVTLKADFNDYFPDCRMRLSKIEEGIEPDSDTQLPEDIDLYIVVGRDDAKN